uniref:G_PROTEIN_RECEP_F1_2 domain-containing protein n=1 Tax=Heterorhabditis bacteriophora TaxID=37862 RepID=A0A1I7X014_HETBA
MVTWIAVIALPVVFSVGTGPWGYHAHNGPENWEKTCQDGFRQINITILIIMM